MIDTDGIVSSARWPVSVGRVYYLYSLKTQYGPSHTTNWESPLTVDALHTMTISTPTLKQAATTAAYLGLGVVGTAAVALGVLYVV